MMRALAAPQFGTDFQVDRAACGPSMFVYVLHGQPGGVQTVRQLVSPADQALALTPDAGQQEFFVLQNLNHKQPPFHAAFAVKQV
jgi:hypothetical protein